MSAATQNEMERLRKEREELEQEREMKTRATNIIDKIMVEVYGAIECGGAEEVHRILNEILIGKDTQLAMLAERDALAARCEEADRLRDRYRADARDLHWKAANAESARDNALAERDTAEEERDALSAELAEARRQLAMMRGA